MSKNTEPTPSKNGLITKLVEFLDPVDRLDKAMSGNPVFDGGKNIGKKLNDVINDVVDVVFPKK